MSDARSTSSRFTPTVHSGRGSRLDRILDLVLFSAKPLPLSHCLDEWPQRLSRLFDADVCSIYLLEGDDLVMRASFGFPQSAVGSVRLAIGEGITGMAVECMRPISLAIAPDHLQFRSFAELGGEDRFPIFFAVPIPGARGPLGALVLQRRTGAPFDQAEMELAMAMTAPIASMVDRSKLVEALRGQRRSVSHGTRRVTLSGRTLTPGRTFGHSYLMRRPGTNSERRDSIERVAEVLGQAVQECRRALEELEGRATAQTPEMGFFRDLHLILDDARLRERALQHWERGEDLTRALATVGAEATRAAARSGDPFAVHRATAITELCEALAAFAAAEQIDIPRSAVFIGNRATIFDLILAVRTPPAAVVVSEETSDSMRRGFIGLFEVPSVVGVAVLFRWVGDGDMLIVDADHGLVRVNPSRAEIALAREQRRQHTEQPAAG